MPAEIDPTKSEAYNTFFPNLEVVDTTLKVCLVPLFFVLYFSLDMHGILGTATNVVIL